VHTYTYTNAQGDPNTAHTHHAHITHSTHHTHHKKQIIQSTTTNTHTHTHTHTHLTSPFDSRIQLIFGHRLVARHGPSADACAGRVTSQSISCEGGNALLVALILTLTYAQRSTHIDKNNTHSVCVWSPIFCLSLVFVLVFFLSPLSVVQILKIELK